MAKRPAPAPPASSSSETKRLKSAVRTLVDELVTAEYEVDALRLKLQRAGALLDEAGLRLSSPLCTKIGCTREGLVKLHDCHHVCLQHFSHGIDLLSPEDPVYECPACKASVSEGIEITPLANRRARFSADALEKGAAAFCKSEAWRSHTRKALAQLLALDPDELFSDAGEQFNDYGQRKRLRNYEDKARPGKPVLHFEWNGLLEEQPAVPEQEEEDDLQCAQRPD